MTKQEILTVLRDDDKHRCLDALRVESEANADATTLVLLEALEGTDKQLSSRSAWVLVLLPLKELPEVANALAVHLQTDPNAAVRLCCAVGLVSNETPSIRSAYIHAVKDEDEKVAQFSCMQLGFRPGLEVTAALFDTLYNPSWNVRLAACNALILLEAADKRVVATLEAMAQEPEAKTHDADMEEFERNFGEIQSDNPDEMKLKMWAKIGVILERARQIAARQG